MAFLPMDVGSNADIVVQNATASSLQISSSRLSNKTTAYMAFSGPAASNFNAQATGTCSNGNLEWITSSLSPYAYNMQVAKITNFSSSSDIKINNNTTIGNFCMLTIVL